MHDNIFSATKEMHLYKPNLGDTYKMMSHPKFRVINRVAIFNFLKRYYPELSNEDPDSIFRYLGLEREQEISYDKFIKFLYP